MADLKWVPDTSVIIHGKLSAMITAGEIKGELIIPEAVIDELQAQASGGREIGFQGLNELKNVQTLAAKNKDITTRFVGRRPTMEEIMLAKKGRIDAIIRDVAREEHAMLITADYVQALVAEAQGVAVRYILPEPPKKHIKLENFFDSETTSVHLKTGVCPMAKRGKPGRVKLVKLSQTPMTEDEIEYIIKEVMDKLRIEEDAFIEISTRSAMVVQLGPYRIAIARTPFSDGLELTAVRPITKLTLDDYKLSEKLMKRLRESAKGVIICGPPGSGKSTFAASLAEFYVSMGKIVKTIESPRDLQVPPEVTQYGPLNGSFEKTADILLLVRPDFTIYDELRKTSDFEIFADMRMAGVGMSGVVHSTEPIDAVQRFMSRVELGVIPSVVDTIIFVKDGEIKKVYELSHTVKVPTGMVEADLARPVIEVRDFEGGKCEYEIYTYGEEKVVVPVTEAKMPAIRKLAAERIMEEVKRFDANAKVELISDNKVVVRVGNDVVPRLIGKEGKTVMELEKKLGISIDVEPAAKTLGKQVAHKITESGAYILIRFDEKLSGSTVSMFIGDEFLFSATVGKSGVIKVAKDSDIGASLTRAVVNKRVVKSFL